MKVYQLMWKLLWCKPTDLVVIVKPGTDTASPVSDVDKMTYDADSTWSGDIYIRKLTDSLRKARYTEEDLCAYGGEDCIALWPIN